MAAFCTQATKKVPYELERYFLLPNNASPAHYESEMIESRFAPSQEGLSAVSLCEIH
jgi:hypothetical protein